MRYGYGRGLGFRGYSPPWPYIGRGRGGLSRCAYPGWWEEPFYPGAGPYGAAPAPEDELRLMRSQASAMRSQLQQLEARIRDLEQQEHRDR